MVTLNLDLSLRVYGYFEFNLVFESLWLLRIEIGVCEFLVTSNLDLMFTSNFDLYLRVSGNLDFKPVFVSLW